MRRFSEDTLDFVRRGLAVRRYHQRYTAVVETVASHSAGVAMFLIMMNEELPSGRLLAAALCHDLPEGVTGDIPSPAKRAMGVQAKDELDQYEHELLDKRNLVFTLTTDEHRQLKLADCLDGFAFCIEELRRGNRNIIEVGNRYREYLAACGTETVREAEVLMTLDRQWKELTK